MTTPASFLIEPAIFGYTVIERLLPHRTPFLMIESVVSYIGGNNPTLHAKFPIRSSESVFSRNDEIIDWPSMYTIEGLGQCCNLLNIISSIENRLLKNGLMMENVVNVLKGFEENRDDKITNILKGAFEKGAMETISRVGLLGSVDVEILGRVSIGQLLLYEVQQTMVYGGLAHFSTKAFNNGELIAQGILIGTSGDKLGGVL